MFKNPTKFDSLFRLNFADVGKPTDNSNLISCVVENILECNSIENFLSSLKIIFLHLGWHSWLTVESYKPAWLADMLV